MGRTTCRIGAAGQCCAAGRVARRPHSVPLTLGWSKSEVHEPGRGQQIRPAGISSGLELVKTRAFFAQWTATAVFPVFGRRVKSPVAPGGFQVMFGLMDWQQLV